jgi:NADH:ubiquinone oxidoreductase subunit 5 (chain L)/Multisubunit Na+/H+ antiporter, MnhA subunit
MHHEQDMRRMGNLRKYMPITFITMLMGWLAICGIPIWAGFFSKDEILYKTFAAPNLPGNWNYVLWGVGLLTAVLTAVYMTRLMVMTFFGSERFHEALPDLAHADDAAHAEENAFASGEASDDETHQGHSVDDDDEEHHHVPHDFKPHESPWTMTVPLIVLAVLSTFGGLVGIPYAISRGSVANVFENTLEPIIAKVNRPVDHAAPSLVATGHSGTAAVTSAETTASAVEAKPAEHSPEELRTELLLAALSVLLALSGIAIGWTMFIKTPLREMPKILQEKWRIDQLYNGYIVDPLTNISREGLWRGFDLGFIDGIVNGIGHFVMELGSVVRQVQVGFVRSYAAFILMGAIVVIGYFIYFGFKLIG